MRRLRKLPIKRDNRGAGPQIMPDGLNEDGAQALASLDTLLGIEADLLLPGHGDPWTQGVTEAVRQAKAAGRS